MMHVEFRPEPKEGVDWLRDDDLREGLLGCFMEFLREGDGTLGRDVLLTILCDMDEQAFTREKASQLFDAADADKDGRIYLNAFVTYVAFGKRIGWSRSKPFPKPGELLKYCFPESVTDLSGALVWTGTPVDAQEQSPSFRKLNRGALVRLRPGLFHAWAERGQWSRRQLLLPDGRFFFSIQSRDEIYCGSNCLGLKLNCRGVLREVKEIKLDRSEGRAVWKIIADAVDMCCYFDGASARNPFDRSVNRAEHEAYGKAFAEATGKTTLNPGEKRPSEDKEDDLLHRLELDLTPRQHLEVFTDIQYEFSFDPLAPSNVCSGSMNDAEFAASFQGELDRAAMFELEPLVDEPDGGLEYVTALTADFFGAEFPFEAAAKQHESEAGEVEEEEV
mmetsp:Transcript_68957/g.190908  ORF Transcript_68957/g.190908 Transcript_68957/m.190908 type:complete len:390 (+) Transcript_68957:152-1321(+)